MTYISSREILSCTSGQKAGVAAQSGKGEMCEGKLSRGGMFYTRLHCTVTPSRRVTVCSRYRLTTIQSTPQMDVDRVHPWVGLDPDYKLQFFFSKALINAVESLHVLCTARL